MSEQRAPYHVGQEPTIDPAHKHLFRVAFGNKNILRFCERCGRTWGPNIFPRAPLKRQT